jgi:hypothetical protein
VDYTLLFSSSQSEIHSPPKLHLKSYEILHNTPQGTPPLGVEDPTIKKINIEDIRETNLIKEKENSFWREHRKKKTNKSDRERRRRQEREIIIIIIEK